MTRGVPRWDRNFNEGSGKYEVAYYFKSGFDENRKNTVRTKLAEFARDTCVALVEKNQNDSNYRPGFSLRFERIEFLASNSQP